MDKSSAPVFVKIEEYKDIVDVINLIKNKINDAKKTLNEINELKNKEDEELAAWHSELTEIEKRMDFVNRVLFEPESF